MKALRWFLFVCLFLGLLPSVTSKIAAQSNACAVPTYCEYDSIGGDCFPHLPPGVFDCYGADFTLYCSVRSNQCPPAKAQDENPRCLECERLAALAGRPIQLANGNVYFDQVDINVPGLGGGLRLIRSWNSLWPPTQSAYRTGMFGANWRSNFEERIYLGDDGFIKYARGDGNFWSFGYAGSSWLPAAPASASAVLTQTSTNWVLTFKNGEKRLFDLTSGWLASITDRNGNTTSLTYDGLNRIITVTDPVGRHLTFTYASGSSYQVVGVSSDLGLSLTYAYNGDGLLSQVTKPDQSKWKFEYDTLPYGYPLLPNPYITAIKDENGKVLESHTYDCYGRGLSSSRAGGVESVTVSYGNNSYARNCFEGLSTVSQ